MHKSCGVLEDLLLSNGYFAISPQKALLGQRGYTSLPLLRIVLRQAALTFYT